MLEIKDLHAGFEGTEIINGISLTVKKGETHAVMGPNGSGKSTLAKVLVGHPAYEVTSGEVLFQGKNLLEMETDERSLAGVFMGFQYPVEIPGVNNAEFMRMAYNASWSMKGRMKSIPLTSTIFFRKRWICLEWKINTKSVAVMMGFLVAKRKKMKFFKWLS